MVDKIKSEDSFNIPRVIVHVSGGVADIVYCYEAEGIILDFDEYEDYENMGSEIEGYRCPHCDRFSSEFKWNAATMHSFGSDNTIRIQNSKGKDEFSCPTCFRDSFHKNLKKEAPLWYKR